MKMITTNVKTTTVVSGAKNNSKVTLAVEDIEMMSNSKEIKSIRNTKTIDDIIKKSSRKCNKVSAIEVFDDKEKDRLQYINADTLSRMEELCKRGYTFFTTLPTFKVEPSSHWNGLLGFAIIAGIIASTLAFTCWPRHNVISFPEYWYEPLIPLIITSRIFLAAFIIIEARMLLKAQEILTLRSFWLYYFFRALGDALLFLLIYCVWVKFLGFPHPMPRTFTVMNLFQALAIAPISNWLIFPSDMRSKNSSIRNKLFLFTLFNWLRMFMTIVYSFVPNLPFIRHEYLQLSVGLLFPMMETFNMWWNSKFTKWAFDCDLEIASIENIVTVQCCHSFSLTILLGSANISRWSTIILILADTVTNCWSVRNIIRHHRQGTEDAIAIRDRSLKFLALKEFLEVLVPIAYLLSFIGSYIGPNYDIIGGMGSDLGHHEKLSSLYEKLEETLIFMIAEALRGVVFAVVLWKFFGLSMYLSYCDVVKKYGLLILTVGAYANTAVYDCYLLVYKIF